MPAICQIVLIEGWIEETLGILKDAPFFYVLFDEADDPQVIDQSINQNFLRRG